MRFAPLALLLAGCLTATLLRAPGAARSNHAPANEDASLGEVKYLNAGGAAPIAERKEDAYRQMHVACDGDYTVTSARAVGEYEHLTFRCSAE